MYDKITKIGKIKKINENVMNLFQYYLEYFNK